MKLKLHLATLFSRFYPWLLFTSYTLIIGFIFYNLLIVERTPKNLSQPVNMSQWIIYVCLFLTNFLLFLFLLNRLRKNKKVNLFYFRIMLTILHVTQSFYKTIATSYLILIYYSDSICTRYDQFLYLNFTWFYFLNKKTRLWFFRIILVFPKAFVLLSLIYDVFFIKEIHYFYTFLGLLIIPFLIRFCNFIYTKSYEIQNDIFDDFTAECSFSDEDIKLLSSFWSKVNLTFRNKLLLAIKKIIALFHSIVFYPKEDRYSLMSKYIGYTYLMYPIIQELEEEQKKIHFKLNLILRGTYACIFGYIVIITSI